MLYKIRYFLIEEDREEELFLCSLETHGCPVVPQVKQQVDLWEIIEKDLTEQENINYDIFKVIGIQYIYLSPEEMMIDILCEGNFFSE